MDTFQVMVAVLFGCVIIAAVLSEYLKRKINLLTGQLQADWQKEVYVLREEMSNLMEKQTNQLLSRQGEIAGLQNQQIHSVTVANEERMNRLEEKVSLHLEKIREDNNTRLKEMRMTVEEQLQSNLDKKLGESFKQVSERLEQVYKGLGEMQNLAVGVGDLKKVLSNIKTRGTWGEVQLGNLLEQILAPEQYEANVMTKPNSNARVEYAVKMPGKNEESGSIWLPIDAKFPMESYQALLQAQEDGDSNQIHVATRQLEIELKKEGKMIHDKYLDPPQTTDFALLFLPVEGLYAEVLRIPGLTDTLQRDLRVMVAGPTTLAALLNSLQMGFRTLAVEKKAGEAWQLLGAIKTEFGRFGQILAKTQKKLQEASNTIEDAGKRSRAIERKLRQVEELPQEKATELLPENWFAVGGDENDE